MDRDVEQVLREVTEILGPVPCDVIAGVAQQVRGARRVFVHGQGRTGLMCRAFAMRLMHLGLSAHAVGDATAPAIGAGDVLLSCSGSAASSVVVEAARKAREAGAGVLAVTGSADSSLARSADVALVVLGEPSQQEQFGGSPFEQSLLIFLDAVVLRLVRELGASHEDMSRRHANLP